MQSFIKPYITLEKLPDLAILIPEKLNTINAVVFFSCAEKVEVLEEKFLCFFVYLKNKKFLLVESGISSFSLLSRMKELEEKGVKKYIFVNKAYKPDKKKSPNNIFLINKSVLNSSKKSISLNTELMAALNKNQSIKTGNNLSMDIDDIFFKKSIKPGKKEISGFDTLSIGDYYFLKYLKQKKLSGAAINYIGDEGKYFTAVMNLVVDYLRKWGQWGC